MGRAACVSPNTLLLGHIQIDTEKRLIIVIGKIHHPFLAIQELCHITREIHSGIVFDGSDCHFLDLLDRKIDIHPVLTVINVSVIVNLVNFIIFTAGVIHNHHIIVLKILAHILVIKALGSVELAFPFKFSGRNPYGKSEKVIHLFEHIHLHLLKFRIRLSLLTEYKAILAKKSLEMGCPGRSVVGAIRLRHYLSGNKTILGYKIGDACKLTAVAHRILKKPIDGSVLKRLVLCINDSLKEEICLFELVVKENITLRKLERPQIMFGDSLGSENIQSSEKPAASGRLLVCDSICFNPVGKLSVNHRHI